MTPVSAAVPELSTLPMFPTSLLALISTKRPHEGSASVATGMHHPTHPFVRVLFKRGGQPMINKKRLLCALWLSVFLSVPVAFAGNDRSWVASTGSDSNPCTRSQPCATFQGALAKTNAGGEIDVVDPGDYGTIQSFSSGGFTIDGGGMAHISVVGGDWAIVVLNASGPVIVRNLTVNGGGIWFSGPGFKAENVT